MVLEVLAFQQVEPHVFTKNISTYMSTTWIDHLSEHMTVRSDLCSKSLGPSLEDPRNCSPASLGASWLPLALDPLM